jgi:hypothetical protein
MRMGSREGGQEVVVVDLLDGMVSSIRLPARVWFLLMTILLRGKTDLKAKTVLMVFQGRVASNRRVRCQEVSGRQQRLEPEAPVHRAAAAVVVAVVVVRMRLRQPVVPSISGQPAVVEVAGVATEPAVRMARAAGVLSVCSFFTI